VSTTAVAVAVEPPYSVRIGPGCLDEVAACAASYARCMIVSEPRVFELHGERLAALDAPRHLMPPGEAAKELGQVEALLEALAAAGLGRDALLVTLGGGALSDAAGLAAALYMRGIDVVHAPTTLLAQVDASVGGKTAVNLPQGKNLAGAFHQPSLVWIDTACLKSLPMRARAAGMAEVVKVAAIWDEAFFARLERDCDRILALDSKVLLPVLERSIRIKAEVVRRDEREQSGLRALLNFGHTVGHAVERQAGYRRILHGEAVSIGMVHGAQRSEDLGLAPAGTRSRLEALLRRLGLPVELPRSDRRAHLDAIQVDKKKVGRKIDYVVLRGIGRAGTVALTPAQILPARRSVQATNRRGS